MLVNVCRNTFAVKLGIPMTDCFSQVRLKRKLVGSLINHCIGAWLLGEPGFDACHIQVLRLKALSHERVQVLLSVETMIPDGTIFILPQ